MLHRVAGERGVIGFQVELEVFGAAVFAQEVQARCGVEVVLAFGRFLGFGRRKRPFESYLLRVIDGHVEKFREVLESAFHIGVPEPE